MKRNTEQKVQVWGHNDWASYYGKLEQLDLRVEEILMNPCPFHKGKLVAQTHFAFIGIPDINGDPLTVEKWFKLHSTESQLKLCFSNNAWHVCQPHIDIAVMETRLYVVLRETVPGSTGKTPEKQVAMLPSEYDVPSTIVEVTKDILLFRKTGKRCNSSDWARCSEQTVETSHTLAGRFSCVGNFYEDGLLVSRWDRVPHSNVGVGASLKIPLLKF